MSDKALFFFLITCAAIWVAVWAVGFIQRRSQKRRDEYRDEDYKPLDSGKLIQGLKKSYYSGDRDLFKRGKRWKKL